MKIKEIKEILNSLSDEQVEGNLVVIGDYSSGIVFELEPAETNLYYLGEDDPAELLNEIEMAERVESEGDDEMPEPYIKKGEMILRF